MIFARKMPEFYIIIARKKNIFPQILGGHVPPLPPVSYVYVYIAPFIASKAT